MSEAFQDFDLTPAAEAATLGEARDANATSTGGLGDILSKDILPEDLLVDSRTNTATSLSLDLSKGGGNSSTEDSESNSALVERESETQRNSLEASPLEGLDMTKMPLSTPASMVDNSITSSVGASGNNENEVNNGNGIDPNLLNNNLFMDTVGLSPTNGELSGPDPYSQPNLNSLLDDYVSTEMLLNNDTQGPLQEAIASPVPENTDSRGSISHSVDFWNLPNNPKARRRTTAFTGIDSELADVLNGYHLNLRRNSFTNSAPGVAPPSQRHGFKKQPQRSSMSVLDGSLNTDLFNKLYENGVPSSNLKLVSPYDNKTNDGDQSLHSEPNLDPLVSPRSPKTVMGNGNGNSNRNANVDSHANTNNGHGGSHGGTPANATNPLKQPNQDFINPSMVLSDNASASAKVATTGNGANDNDNSYDLSLDPQAIMRESPTVAEAVNNIPSPPVLPAELSPSPPQEGNLNVKKQDSFGLAAPPLPPPVEQHQQRQEYEQRHPQPMPAPTAARRRRSTANIMTVNHGNGGISSYNQSSSGSRNNNRSITPMSASDEDAKPFKCKECTKAFRRSEHLKRHIRSVHSSERPFACMFCEKKFSRSDNLSQHLKTHKKHGDF